MAVYEMERRIKEEKWKWLFIGSLCGIGVGTFGFVLAAILLYG